MSEVQLSHQKSFDQETATPYTNIAKASTKVLQMSPALEVFKGLVNVVLRDKV